MPQARRTVPVGTRVGRLIVIEDVGSIGGVSSVRIECDCGTERILHANRLIRAIVDEVMISCGCWRRERLSKTADSKAMSVSNMPGYSSWSSMLGRCYRPDTNGYENYGGRGIVVCERWRNSFDAFISDMGKRPSKSHTLDRLDINGNYEPANCRWATISEQARNKRNSAFITLNGIARTVAEWREITGLSRRSLEYRLHCGWTPEQILSTPPRITSLTKSELRFDPTKETR